MKQITIKFEVSEDNYKLYEDMLDNFLNEGFAENAEITEDDLTED